MGDFQGCEQADAYNIIASHRIAFALYCIYAFPATDIGGSSCLFNPPFTLLPSSSAFLNMVSFGFCTYLFLRGGWAGAGGAFVYP